MTSPSSRPPAGTRPGRGRSIGAVLAEVQQEFPDVSISKIRFLEAEGLVTPERTESGYRTFAPTDVERLRYILRAQRDHFWPLKVIREALDALDRGLEPPAQGNAVAKPSVPPPVADPTLPTAASLRATTALRLTAAELCASAGLDETAFASLITYGLVHADASGLYDQAALDVARAAGSLAGYGIEPRHLRPFRTAADREVGLVQQVVSPLRGRAHTRRTPDAAPDPTAEILALCIALHAGLVKQGLATG